MTAYVLLAVVGLILLRGMMTGRDAYGAFLRGAKQGMTSAAGLLPALCGMLLLIRLTGASGLMELLAGLASPLLEMLHIPQEVTPMQEMLHIPQEVTPMLLLRPLTGSGSLAALQEIMHRCGPDSRAASIASVLAGSSETILYTLTVYAAAAGVKHVPGALLASLCGYAASIVVCSLLVR